MEPRFFASPDEFRSWLVDQHQTETELLVGFYKTHTGKPSMTWSASVDQALCFGWIDGVRRSLGDEAYTIRFTPRKSGGTWSAVNVAKMAELLAAGLVHPAGVRAFEARSAAKTAIYAYEQPTEATFDPGQEALFRAEPGAWEWFQSQAPWYRRTAAYWVQSAKRPHTRASRLAELINDSGQHRRIRTQRRTAEPAD